MESQKRMGNVIFGMMVSLDGFVADRTGSVRRLYPEGRVPRKHRARGIDCYDWSSRDGQENLPDGRAGQLR